MMESQAAPTMIFYEKYTHSKPLTDQELDRVKPMLREDEVVM